MTLSDTQFETDILSHVRRPQRYAGRELHRVLKPRAELRVAIAFPDLYEIAMSSLAVQILYHRLNSDDEAIAGERVFLPAEDAAGRFRATGLPLATLESRTPLHAVDIVGISLSYEMAIPGMLELLDLGQLPIHADQRREDHPIVIAGGPVAYNPEPFAPFVDLVAVGDGEELILELAREALALKRRGIGRAERILRLADIAGVYRPAAHEVTETAQGPWFIPHDHTPLVQGRLVEGLPRHFYPDRPLVPLTEVTFDRISLEVMRGCTRGCRFCQAGTLYRPVRERPVDEIVAQARANVNSTGHDEISLLSLSTSDYGELPALIDALQEEFRGEAVSLAFPSLRPDSFTAEMAGAFPGSRKAGITFAPEAGTQRLRDVINKNSREEDVLRAAQLAFREGYTSVKLYFMMGLPTERDEDLEGIARLAARVAALRSNKRQRVTVSVSPFAPKPHTPFQRFGQVSVDEIRRRTEVLRRAFRGVKARLTMHDPESALVETTIARGDRRMADVIERVWRDGGVLEAWHDRFQFERWDQAYRDAGLDPESVAGELTVGEPLPWGHVSKGVRERFHEREWKKAEAARITSDCREGRCHACGLERMIPEDSLVCNLLPTMSLLKPTVEDGTTTPNGDVLAVARVRYERGPELRWSGHLDMGLVWERLLRRARIPVAYSQGFNPHPRLGFGPPLPVGLTSEAEYIDINLSQAVEASDLLHRINEAAPVGLRARDARLMEHRPAALTSAVGRVIYGLTAPEDGTFNRVAEEFLQREHVMVQRISKGKSKTVDIRSFVESLVQEEEGRWELSLSVHNGATARLDELLNAWQLPLESLSALHRRHLLIRDGDALRSPLDVSVRSGQPDREATA